MNNSIFIKNARTNNLKNISVDIPKHKIIAVTGVSGSGKSSFVFDTVACESQRLLSETYSSYIQSLLPAYKKPDVDSISNLPVSLVIDQKQIRGNARSTVGTITDIYTDLRLLYARLAMPFIGYSMKYSFNNPEGMCKTCQGLGVVTSIDIDRLINFDKSLNENAIRFPTFLKGGWRLTRYTESGYFDNNKRIADYSREELELLLYAPKRKPEHPTKNWHKTASYIGVIPRIMEGFIHTENSRYKKDVEKIKITKICPACHGARLNEEALRTKINGRSIADCADMDIPSLRAFINEITDIAVKPITDELKAKLEGLSLVGLDYVKLNQPTNTLSGGESQRIKMVRHLTSPLSDVLYIFDEPSAGLHPQDLKGIISIFKGLKDKGNTIVLVDHDPDVIKECDYIINFGEGAGIHGGRITFQGHYKDLLRSHTITANALLKEHAVKKEKKLFSEFYTLENVSKYNINHLSLKIPKHAVTVVTGVAGSGKSTLIRDIFKNTYPDSSLLDQSLPHASGRSTLITYLGVYDEIKRVFGNYNHVDPSLFSVIGKGSCPKCKGKGTINLDLAYLGASVHPCETCQGKRFNDTALSYFYRGKNISNVFEMSAIEARRLFSDYPVIRRALDSVVKANLSYITLGQTLDTYSGGELQRLKIAQLLSHQSAEIIILDEPTTGLHEADIDKLTNLVQEMVKKNRTVIVIEHNLSMISQADWIIDLGPKGGRLGGKLIFQGYPVDFIQCQTSYTAVHLRRFLKIT